MKRKSYIAAILACCLALTACGGTTPEEPVQSEEVTTTEVTTTTPAETTSAVTTTDKVIWTGSDYDNPVNKDKYEGIITRLVANLSQRGINVVGIESNDIDSYDDTTSPVLDDTSESASLSDDIEYNLGDDLATEKSEIPEATSVEEEFVEFNMEDAFADYIEELESYKQETKFGMPDPTTVSVYETDNIELPAYPEEVLATPAMTREWESKLKSYALTQPNTWVDSFVYMTLQSTLYSKSDWDAACNVNSNVRYKILGTEWRDTTATPDILSTMSMLYTASGMATFNTTYLPALTDWTISPGTYTKDMLASYTDTADKWGIPSVGIDKIFYAYDLLQKGDDDDTLFQFKVPTQDYAALTKMFEALFTWVSVDDSPNLFAYLKDSTTESIVSQINDLYVATLTDEQLADTTLIDFVPETIAGTDSDTALYLAFKDKFVTLMGEKAWRELQEYIPIDEMSYAEFYARVNAISDNTTTNYGIAYTDGISATLRTGKVVDDFDWYLGFSIVDDGITLDQLRSLVMDYIVMVGSLTGESYSRSLDIAASGLINKTISGTYSFAIDYINDMAIATIIKS